MKRFIKDILSYPLYKLLELIEWWEYRNLELDEDDISKKIINSSDIDLSVKSDKGYVPASQFHITQPYTVYRLQLENGLELECADNHLVFTSDLKEVFVKELTTEHILYTENGPSKVKKVKKLPYKISMCDLSIDTPEHRYYTNGILSHNTINASIFILWYCIFTQDQNILLVGNLWETVKEVLAKIKAIYYGLPWWLKPGVSNWNQTQVTFKDTGCKIKTVTSTGVAGAGNTISLLYYDEFALVPQNVLSDFYASTLPTIASLKNSKIIITSTPRGYNLFHTLLTDAERPRGDKKKNRFQAKRVYWYEVPGRFVTYIRLYEHILKDEGLKFDEIFHWIKDMGFDCKKVYNYESLEDEIHISNIEKDLPEWFKEGPYQKEVEDRDVIVSDYFRSQYYTKNLGEDKEGRPLEKRYRLIDLADISSWKEDAIKDLGGSKELFNQEYGLEFVSANDSLFDAQTMEKIINEQYDFEWSEIQVLEDKTYLDYGDLKWIKGRPDLFELSKIKDYTLILSIDLSEGLGGDYSVFNIFRVMPKEKEKWPKKIGSLSDFFKLEQVGIFHTNRMSIPELGELLYLICFEVCDQNKLGAILEVNAFGGELILAMRSLWEGRNDFSDHIFLRYKHRQDSEQLKLGIKLRQQKNLYVKEYQKRMRLGDIRVHEERTLYEVKTFVKKETKSGNITYEGTTYDDIVMTNVQLSTIFKHYKMLDFIDFVMKTMAEKDKEEIMRLLGEAPNIQAADYTSLFNAKKQVAMQDAWSNMMNQQNQNPFSGGSTLSGNNNPFASNF